MEHFLAVCINETTSVTFLIMKAIVTRSEGQGILTLFWVHNDFCPR